MRQRTRLVCSYDLTQLMTVWMAQSVRNIIRESELVQIRRRERPDFWSWTQSAHPAADWSIDMKGISEFILSCAVSYDDIDRDGTKLLTIKIKRIYRFYSSL